ncbi:MAG: ABC transporter permease [Ilumatobacteraceae bacterium]
MPLRNVLRAPRRTVLTAAGVGASITALVATLGLLDSFTAAIDRGVAEAAKGDPGRISVALDTYYPVSSPEVTAVIALPGVATADPTLSVPASARVGTGEPLDLLLELLDFSNAQWTPTIIDAIPDGPTSGLVLTAKAARDLGVEPGDTVVLRHPRLGLAGIELVDTDMVVAAVHPAPIRSFAFLDHSFAAEFGLAGIANGLQVTPAAGTTRDELQRSIFDLAGIGSAQPVARVGEVFDSALDQFVGVLYIAEGAVLVLALLIAFNSTRISVDERRREHATMLAFGMRLRTLIGIVVGEAVVIGVLATLVGLAAGVSVQRWMLQTITGQTVPEFDLPVVLAPTSIAVAFAVGVASTALAPLFVIGRLRRMNLPDTLRVME